MVGQGDLGCISPADFPAVANVLLVEDSDTSRLMTRAVLEQARFRVETAENGLEALQALHRGRAFDIILMDLDMPVMDGFAATAAIRALDKRRGGGTPILALTACRSDPSSRAAMNGYVAKPFEPLRLVDEIIRTLREHAERADDHGGHRVWNRERYNEVVSRLGAAKIEKHLALVREKLDIVRDKLLSDPEDANVLAWEAHALISPASVLGFDDLIDACTRARVVGAATGCRSLSLELAAAIERVLRALSDVGTSST